MADGITPVGFLVVVDAHAGAQGAEQSYPGRVHIIETDLRNHVEDGLAFLQGGGTAVIGRAGVSEADIEKDPDEGLLERIAAADEGIGEDEGRILLPGGRLRRPQVHDIRADARADLPPALGRCRSDPHQGRNHYDKDSFHRLSVLKTAEAVTDNIISSLGFQLELGLDRRGYVIETDPASQRNGLVHSIDRAQPGAEAFGADRIADTRCQVTLPVDVEGQVIRVGVFPAIVEIQVTGLGEPFLHGKAVPLQMPVGRSVRIGDQDVLLTVDIGPYTHRPRKGIQCFRAGAQLGDQPQRHEKWNDSFHIKFLVPEL